MSTEPFPVVIERMHTLRAHSGMLHADRVAVDAASRGVALLTLPETLRAAGRVGHAGHPADTYVT